jgi:hypothetical protein
MRQFHLTFPLPDNFQSVIGKSTGETSGGSQQPILQSVIEKSSQSAALAPIGQFNRRSSVKFACALTTRSKGHKESSILTFVMVLKAIRC